MSRAAVSRQIGKLVRRGYVRPLAGTRRPQYQLARGGNGPLHARLLEIVSAHWEREAFES